MGLAQSLRALHALPALRADAASAEALWQQLSRTLRQPPSAGAVSAAARAALAEVRRDAAGHVAALLPEQPPAELEGGAGWELLAMAAEAGAGQAVCPPFIFPHA